MEAAKDRVKKICDALRKEALEPARAEAAKIIEAAEKEAWRIRDEAKSESEAMLNETHHKIQSEQEIFETSLSQASRQAIEFLKQKIEESLFQPGLKEMIERQTKDPKVLSELITAVVRAIDREGASVNLSVAIPAQISADRVNALLSSQILERLKEKGVLLSSLGGGIEVKLLDEKMTIDLSAETLKELVATYIRKDFRKLFFG